MRAFSAIALLFGLLPALAASAATVQGSLTASLGPGLDTDPSRTVGKEASLDGYLGLSASGKLKLGLGDSQQLSGRYDVGLRKFFRKGDEDLAVQQAGLDWQVQLGRAALGAELSGKWWVSVAGSRDYADLGAQLFLDLALVQRLTMRLNAGAHGFLYPPAQHPDPDATGTAVDADRAYDWVGPQGGWSLRWQPSRRHVAQLALFGALPYYRGWSRYEGSADFANGSDGLEALRRRDAQFGGQVSYSYRGPVAVQGGYTYVRVNSTSYGEAIEKHRLWAAASAKLPLRLYASLQASWQFIVYPDGVYLSPQLQLLDDESQGTLGAKLAFAATERFDVELKYAVLRDAPPQAEEAGTTVPRTWWRHTAFLGVTFRL